MNRSFVDAIGYRECLLFLAAPDHVRAINNKIYYEDLLRNRTIALEQEKIDLSSGVIKLLPNAKKTDAIKIKNPRPSDYLEEREVYEQLCRQNGSKVSSNSIARGTRCPYFGFR